MSLRQRIIFFAEFPFPTLASVARQEVPSRGTSDGFSCDPEKIQRPGWKRRGPGTKFAWMNPCEKMQAYNPKTRHRRFPICFKMIPSIHLAKRSFAY